MSRAGEKDRRSVRVRISGRVQGVGFRDWTRRRAVALGLSGWVRNRPDGTVEAAFSGSAAAVEAILAACREGPQPAVVDAVEVTGSAVASGGAFDIR